MWVQKSQTTFYHPQGNGSRKSFNQTQLDLLKTWKSEQLGRWVENLPSLVHVYNYSVHSITGYAPAFLMFGRHLGLPLELVMGVLSQGVQSTRKECVRKHHEQLTCAYWEVSESLQLRTNACTIRQPTYPLCCLGLGSG